MYLLKRTLLGVLVVALAATTFSGIVSAQSSESLTDEVRQRIVANCVPIKNTLARLHASDALLRVNRGQVYESLGSRVMDTFNARLSNNRLDNKAMTTISSQYRTALTKFRTDYISYEQKLSEALRIDCASQPDRFYAATAEARTLRATVHEDVQKLHRVMDDYSSSVGDFLLNYERVSR